MIGIDEVRESIHQLEQSDGWELVKKYIDERIADHTGQLLHCKLEDVTLHRNSIKTLELIYDHIESLKSTEVDQQP